MRASSRLLKHKALSSWDSPLPGPGVVVRVAMGDNEGMPSIDTYIQNASHYAQETVNAWGLNHRAGNASKLTDEFNTVFELACKYMDARKTFEAYQGLNEFGKLNSVIEAARAEEARKRQAFAEAYKSFEEKHIGGAVS